MKPFQAASVIVTGAAERYLFTPQEIALIAGSHSAEPKHLKGVKEILKKGGIPPSALYCGPALPFYAPALRKLLASGGKPSRLHHNCSGKHAGLLAAAKTFGNFRDYYSTKHQIQKLIFKIVSEYCDVSFKPEDFGIDGCALPNMSLPLRSMALGFARLGEEFGETAVGIVGKSMSKHPWYVGGTKRFDTELMQAIPGMVAKGGAEGLFCISIPKEEIGIAIKCEDGAFRALAVIALQLLVKLGIASSAGAKNILKKHPQWNQILNSRKEKVGEIVPSF